jgi:hypothetical protein
VDEQLDLAKWMWQTEKCGQSAPAQKTVQELQWTGSIVQFVELFYSIHVAKTVNEGMITLKDLFGAACEIFHIDAGSYSRIFIEIKKRAGSRTLFLDKLKAGLIHYMEEADGK